MINTPHPKLIYFKNIRNDGPYAVSAIIYKIYNARAYEEYKTDYNFVKYTTINFHNYIKVHRNGEATSMVDNFWDKIKQDGSSFLHMYNPKYNKYTLIPFNKFKSIQKRK